MTSAPLPFVASSICGTVIRLIVVSVAFIVVLRVVVLILIGVVLVFVLVVATIISIIIHQHGHCNQHYRCWRL